MKNQSACVHPFRILSPENKKMRKFCVLHVFILLALFPTSSFAAHPFKTKHANAYGKGNVRFLLETAMVQEGGHQKNYGLPITEITYSLGQWSLIGIESEYRFIRHSEAVHSTSGMGDVKLYGRYSPFHFDFGHIGAQAGVKIPVAKDDKELGSGETDYEFTLIHSYLGKNVVTHLNCGVEVLGNPKHRSRNEAVATYSAVAVFPLSEKIHYFAEIKGRSAKSVFGNESFLRSGFIIPLGHRLELGFAGGAGLTNDSPDWEARFGLYWTWQRSDEHGPAH